MKKTILRWLFGTDDIESYMDLLRRDVAHLNEELQLLNDHKRSLEREESELKMLRQMLQIFENHGIDVDEEIKHIQLDANDEVQ